MMGCESASLGRQSHESRHGGFELEKTCEHSLLILPAMLCTDSSSSFSLLANDSFFLAQPMYLRVWALSEGSGCRCLALMLAVEAETPVPRDAVGGSDWAVTCSAKGQGIYSSLLHSSLEQSSLG